MQVTRAIIPEWKFDCNLCPEQFNSLNTLAEHIKAIHFFCSKCGAGFLTEKELQDHDFDCVNPSELTRELPQQLSLDGIEPAPMSDYCKFCNIGPFSDANSVQEHEKICKS